MISTTKKHYIRQQNLRFKHIILKYKQKRFTQQQSLTKHLNLIYKQKPIINQILVVYSLYHINMDNIPSKSLSKSLLIATPLFLLILAVLNASNQASYLFVLDFVNNIGGKGDIMFLPTLQPQVHSDNIYRDFLLIGQQIDKKVLNPSPTIPLVNMSHIQQWMNENNIVKGTASRWLFPVITRSKLKVDSLIMVMNISHQNNIGISIQADLVNLEENQIAISQQLYNRLNIGIGDQIEVNFAIKNLLNGMKLIQKYQDPTSSDEFTTQQPQLNITRVSHQFYLKLNSTFNNLSHIIDQDMFTKLIGELYQTEMTRKFKLKYVYKQGGLYPNTLHNVLLIQYHSFAKMLVEFVKENVIENKDIKFKQYVPNEYQALWNIATQLGVYDQQAVQTLSTLLQSYCVIAVSLMHNRHLLYHPQHPLKSQFTKALQKPPQSVQVIALYPFYQQSLSVKYFFGSVIQIFEVVTCVIYVVTMSLIMKQIYEEKEIEVGIWRTLGAGGVKRKQEENYQQQQHMNNDDNHNNELPPLNQSLTLKQKLFYYYKIIVKIGFLYYWLFSSIISILLYIVLKYFFIKYICQLLHFDSILQQNYSSAFYLFIFVFLLSIFLAMTHISNIYTSPLSLTIKPLKRTFDEVKIRIIHLSTFGISSQTLLIALMLIYYGVVSYYWIPFSILDNDGDLQVILFNSIFVFMIFGAIILIAVLQARLQSLILRVIFYFNQRLNKLKLIMLKTIKAKQYKNTKMSIIIAVTFAFLLFFSTGINIEIMIIESFIQRQLGAQLVIQNYEKKSFNQSLVEQYLNGLQSSVRYSWISSDINSQDIVIELINQMDPKRRISCQWKVMSPNYLDSSFYQYYYPQDYIRQNISQYRILPNGVRNGFDALYKYDGVYNNESIGKYNENDTMVDFDPNDINVYRITNNVEDFLVFNDMAPEEQIINFAASSLLKLQMGAKVGDLYKMRITSNFTPYYLNIRSRIVHTYKIGPGMDLFRPQAFITEPQAKYLRKVLGHNQTIRYEKLMITGPQDELRQIGNKIIAMSPQHTEMYEMRIVSQSFSLLQNYLSFYIVFIAIIMGFLAVLFVFIYTLGKCRDEAEMYKMLRAIGVPVKDLRMMIFLEVFVRLLVSIVNGILLGIVFSMGFAMQIEEFLMINTPQMDLSLILSIACVMFIVFSITVYLSTKYLTTKTVADTSK